MATARSYMLLCPIARALDHIGDRWTLLILRDLHAGPARFSELQAGLKGIASNLLTGRLQQLQEDGLIILREAEFGVAVYELSDLGKQSNNILFELARFGGQLPAGEDIKKPGNLRTIAVTLQTACERVVDPALDFTAGLEVDGENFAITVKAGAVDIAYRKAVAPDVIMKTGYEPMMAAAEGRLSLPEFVSEHARIEANRPGKEVELMTLMGAAMTLLSQGSVN